MHYCGSPALHNIYSVNVPFVKRKKNKNRDNPVQVQAIYIECTVIGWQLAASERVERESTVNDEIETGFTGDYVPKREYL